MVSRRLVLATLALAWVGLALPCAARADGPAGVVRITLKDHRFSPNAITVPAGQRVRIELQNLDASTAELESSDMKFEKIVVGGGSVHVFAGPLHPGRYAFFDDFAPDQAHGVMTAVAGP